MTDKAEFLRLLVALAVAVPVTLGYCLLVRWLAFKLLDRWFR